MTLKFVKSLTSIFLLLAFTKMPYGFYSLLRWIVFGVSTYSAYDSYRKTFLGWAWTFLIIGLIFNPFIPVHFNRTILNILDLATATLFISSIFVMER